MFEDYQIAIEFFVGQGWEWQISIRIDLDWVCTFILSLETQLKYFFWTSFKRNASQTTTNRKSKIKTKKFLSTFPNQNRV
jgi:hypothetical protein